MKLLKLLLLSAGVVAGVTTVNAMPPKKPAGKKAATKRAREEATEATRNDLTARTMATQTPDENEVPRETDATVGGRAPAPAAPVHRRHATTQVNVVADTCVICQSDPVLTEDAVEPRRHFVCDHTNMHRACAEQWIARGENNACPSCRAPQTAGVRASLTHIVEQLEGENQERILHVFEPLLRLIRSIARTHDLARPLTSIVYALTSAAQIPPQYRQEILQIINQSMAFGRQAMHGFGFNLEGARQAMLGMLHVNHEASVFLIQILETLPINLTDLQLNAVTFWNILRESHAEEVQAALGEVFERAIEVVPEVGSLVDYFMAMDEGVDRAQAIVMIQPFVIPMIMGLLTTGNVFQATINAVITILQETNGELHAEVLRLCQAGRALREFYREINQAVEDAARQVRR